VETLLERGGGTVSRERNSLPIMKACRESEKTVPQEERSRGQRPGLARWIGRKGWQGGCHVCATAEAAEGRSSSNLERRVTETSPARRVYRISNEFRKSEADRKALLTNTKNQLSEKKEEGKRERWIKVKNAIKRRTCVSKKRKPTKKKFRCGQ